LRWCFATRSYRRIAGDHRKPLARYGATKSALRERLAPAELHHSRGHDQKEADQLDPWIAEASGSLVSSFATGVARDKTAVWAAIAEPWSNGQVEAQITKLKLVKRQMYGRAKLDLLQARLLGAA